MTIIGKLTEIIAGPETLRQREQRAIERRYAGVEKHLKTVRDVSPEAPPVSVSGFASTTSSRVPSRAPSRAVSRSHSPDRIVRPSMPRPELQRSHSEIPLSAKQPRPMTMMPPCITAWELDTDQIKRNYSQDNLQEWDQKKMPLPPLTQMIGIGRYRHSISADPDWKEKHFIRQSSGLNGLQSMITPFAGELTGETNVSDEEWQRRTNSSGRRGSAISSTSTMTTSSTGLSDLCRTQSAPRLTRGFSPSSPIRGSFNAHLRKGSNLSFVHRVGDPEMTAAQNSAPDERRLSNPLATIKELHSTQTSTDKVKKLERPCDFTGDPESAVASDADEEEDAWTDEAESARPSAIGQMLKDGKKGDNRPELTKTRTMSDDKKRARNNTAGLDRSRTVRGTQTQLRRRKSSKHGQIPHQRIKSEEKKPEKNIPALPSPESNSDDSPVVLQMHKSSKAAFQKQADCRHTKDGTILAENQQEYLPRAPRDRSATVLRCSTGALSSPMFAQQAI